MTLSDTYQSPLSSRYASQEMLYLFSDKFKYTTWRKLWFSLAKAQRNLGLNISSSQLQDMEDHIDRIDLNSAKDFEKEVKHEVMSHILAFGKEAKLAKPIIHLGATSSFVLDNTDLIQYKEASKILHQRLLHVISKLFLFAKKHAKTGALSYTHFQNAQPTTIGKRACLWLQDFLEDEKSFEALHMHMPFLGVKGATGSAASFVKLFNGDLQKVIQLEKQVAQDFGFDEVIPIASQTYSRKLDIKIMQNLASFASSTHKFGTDIRLLSHTQEFSERFSTSQVGSSAMPYKKNPIFSERLCGLSRFVISLSENATYTHALQWLERSLDDSSNKRLSLPEAFITADSLLKLLDHIISHLQVNTKRINFLLKQAEFFLIQEDILMLTVQRGGDRQVAHEILKQLSLEIYEHLQNEKLFDFSKHLLQKKELLIGEQDLKSLLTENSFFGASETQCLSFLDQRVSPLLNKPNMGFSESLNV